MGKELFNDNPLCYYVLYSARDCQIPFKQEFCLVIVKLAIRRRETSRI